jgi:hypothetical protein
MVSALPFDQPRGASRLESQLVPVADREWARVGVLEGEVLRALGSGSELEVDSRSCGARRIERRFVVRYAGSPMVRSLLPCWA